MRGARVAMGAGLGLLVLGCVALVQAQDGVPEVKVTDGDRLWENFRREAAVVNPGNFRVEVQGITLNATRDTLGAQVLSRGTPPGNISQNQILTNLGEVSGGKLSLIGSWGVFTNVEIGGQIEGVFQGLRFFNTNTSPPNLSTVGGQVQDASTFGDMWIYGKYRYMVNENLGVAGGVELRLPTGNEGKRTGTGEFGTNPFISTRYSYGRLAAGAHVGFQFNNGDLDDMFNWDVDGMVLASKAWGLRLEFTGWNYNYGGQKINNTYCSPGLEYSFSDSIKVRPQGQFGLTDEALEWGLGVGAAYTF